MLLVKNLLSLLNTALRVLICVLYAEKMRGTVALQKFLIFFQQETVYFYINFNILLTSSILSFEQVGSGDVYSCLLWLRRWLFD